MGKKGFIPARGGGASAEGLTADWLERTVDGESDRRSGRSQEMLQDGA